MVLHVLPKFSRIPDVEPFACDLIAH
jgi:hypothetical protein